MKGTKKLIAPLALLLLAWLMPLDAFAANTTGDVNNDGEVNIADVNAAINIVLGGSADLSGDVNGDNEVTIADINAIITIILDGGNTPTPKDHEWVDLGLPSGTLWATCNIGATNPEDYGDYFAWGETEPKQVYDWQTYKWGYYLQGGMTKYVTASEYGMIDYKTELEFEDDAASANWGPSWCTPSREQQTELYSECSWEWTSINDVNGYMVTGPNGNKLFLPTAGYYEGNSIYDEGSRSEYWSRALRVNLTIYSFTLHLYGGYYGNVNLAEETREKGLSVRAVRVSPDDLFIEQQSLDLGVVPIGETCTGQLTFVNCTMNSMTLTLTADAPFSFNHEEDNASSITVVVPGNSRNTVTVMFTATTPGEFNGNVTIQNSAPDGGQRVIPIHARAITDDFPPHQYVDLGLPSGTLWATMNIGANSPKEYGDYFAWGEITPKEVYSWETYKWCDGTSSSMTKYCIDSYYGLIDHKFELEPADDAAYMNWGPSWRMPTREQQEELSQYCTWQSTSINGINGFLVTGPNGNTLFFPRAGMCDGSTPNNYAGQLSFYWSRSLTCYPNSAYSTNSMGEMSNYRNKGLSVRAVHVSHAAPPIEPQVVSCRGVAGNHMTDEDGYFEITFDQPITVESIYMEMYSFSSGPEYSNDRKTIRYVFKPAKLGQVVSCTIRVRSDFGVISTIDVNIPFYQKKFHVEGSLQYALPSEDKQSVWVTTSGPNKLMQLSLDDGHVMHDIDLTFVPKHICHNPFNKKIYVLPEHNNFLCVVDPMSGRIDETITFDPAPDAHPQYPTIYPYDLQFTNDGFGIVLLRAESSTSLEWRYIDGANNNQLSLSGYRWDEKKFEHLYRSYDGNKLWASIYPGSYTTIYSVSRNEPTPKEYQIHGKFNSDEFYAGGSLMEMQFSPFSNKVFISAAPWSECVVDLDTDTYSPVILVEARNSKAAWDCTSSSRSLVYHVSALNQMIFLLDMDRGEPIFYNYHIWYEEPRNVYHLPASDQLMIATRNGIYLFDASVMRKD